jgi:hypothetical protein
MSALTARLLEPNELSSEELRELRELIAFSLSSDDGWSSAKVSAVQQLGDLYPTTAVLRGGALYVVHSKLNELITLPPEQKAQLR